MAFEFRLPDIGEGVVEGEIVRWMVREGDLLEEDQMMVEVMTDKATVELPSPLRGRVLATNGKEGEIVKVGETLIVIEEAEGNGAPLQAAHHPVAAGAPTASEEPPPEEAPVPAPVRSGRALATPAVRRLARERGIDLNTVAGSGDGGRVTRQDVERLTHASAPTPARAGESTVVADEIVPYRALRKKIGDRMVLSKRTAPHFTYVEEVDMTELVKLRKRFNERPENGQVRLNYLPFFIKAVIKGLKQFPIVNSSLDEAAGEIRIKKHYNIGIATSTENGLIVPVVKNADRKGVLELAAEISKLARQARENRIKIDDLREGTFTITSLGALGGVFATPIINFPEVAILGIHKIVQKPVVLDGQIVIRDRMHLSVSMDHRIVDGATGAEFLNFIIPYIEHPALFSVE